MKEIKTIAKGTNFTATSIGALAEIADFAYLHPQMKRTIEGKVFCGESLHSSGAEISFQSAPLGYTIPFNHAHTEQEEIYLILSGEGFFIVDGERFAVSEGSLVRVGCKGSRQWGNTGREELRFLCIQATEKSLNAHQTSDGYRVM